MISLPEVLVRLGLALVLGAMVGLEREMNEHAAGMRTNALVGLGCSFFMIISIYGFASVLGTPHEQIDPSRIASYVVAGIGFLGAGTIYLRRDQDRVKGLTTAAAIWVVAAIGLACGAGLLIEAITVTILTLFVLVLLRFLEKLLLPRQSSEFQLIRIEVDSEIGQTLDQVYITCKRRSITIETLEIHSDQKGETLHIGCHIPNPAEFAETVVELRKLAGIQSVHAQILGIEREFTSLKGNKK